MTESPKKRPAPRAGSLQRPPAKRPPAAAPPPVPPPLPPTATNSQRVSEFATKQRPSPTVLWAALGGGGILVLGLGIGLGLSLSNPSNKSGKPEAEKSPVAVAHSAAPAAQTQVAASPSNESRDPALGKNAPNAPQPASPTMPKGFGALSEPESNIKPSPAPLASQDADTARLPSATTPPGKTAVPGEQIAAAASGSAPFFDGHDLQGWEGTAGVWKVENGTLVGSLPAGQTAPAFLYSRQTYGDFDLRFRVSFEGPSGDCGVQFRSKLQEQDKIRLTGYECLVSAGGDATNSRAGSVAVEPRGSVERQSPPKLQRFIKPADNHFRIRCQGTHVLIEVNGIKMINADFPALPKDGLIAWRMAGNPPPTKIIFKEIDFENLAPATAAGEGGQFPLRDVELFRAESRYSEAVNKANDELLKHFDTEIKKLQGSKKDADLLAVVTAEKETFQGKGLIPWSAPMRRWLRKYGTDLREARDSAGKAFDRAIDRAAKAHDEELRTALTEEAGQVLAPHPVATWAIGAPAAETTPTKTKRRGGTNFGRKEMVLFSDGTYLDKEHPDDSGARFWAPAEEVLILEFPDSKNPESASQQEFILSRDGKALTTKTASGRDEQWHLVPDLPDDNP
jgi:hypothetical protein